MIPVNEKTYSSYSIPDSNDYVKDLHSSARNTYAIWRAHRKPRDNTSEKTSRI